MVGAWGRYLHLKKENYWGHVQCFCFMDSELSAKVEMCFRTWWNIIMLQKNFHECITKSLEM